MSTFGFMLNKQKKWLNEEIFKGGISFPYKMDQIDTKIHFSENSLILKMQVEKDADVFFE